MGHTINRCVRTVKICLGFASVTYFSPLGKQKSITNLGVDGGEHPLPPNLSGLKIIIVAKYAMFGVIQCVRMQVFIWQQLLLWLAMHQKERSKNAERERGIFTEQTFKFILPQSVNNTTRTITTQKGRQNTIQGSTQKPITSRLVGF